MHFVKARDDDRNSVVAESLLAIRRMDEEMILSASTRDQLKCKIAHIHIFVVVRL